MNISTSQAVQAELEELADALLGVQDVNRAMGTFFQHVSTRPAY